MHKDMIGKLEYAKWLAYEARGLEGIDRKLKLAESLRLLKEILDIEPGFEEAERRFKEYAAEF